MTESAVDQQLDQVNHWVPVSPCGPGCVTAPMPTVGRPRMTLRLVRALGVLLAATVLAPLSALLGSRAREAAVRWVFAALLRAFGARLEVHGDRTFGGPAGDGPHRGALVALNHVSWLDIVAVNGVRPMPSVAKHEIRAWPVVGALASRAGTVFLDRGRLRVLPAAIGELSTALRAGSLVSAYPEGTTWCGRTTGRFRPAMFQAAIDGGVPVRPIALRYRLTDGSATSWPAFVGDETLIDSVCRTARLRGLVVELHILDEIAPGRAAGRRELAALTEARIRAVVEPAGRLPELTDHAVAV
ncbi:MAG TPA: lysophospholipid acyltransferase family protein [Pseudonocardiaceae bacterium]|jgi:1-acyl-sn-glycerol-3-phosphate acyltransferase|nr:lysophospholipid acyltransferase family protein [Pseudonocardiaceae bacterium]